MKFNKWYFNFLLVFVFCIALYSSFYIYNFKKSEFRQNQISRAETMAHILATHNEWTQLSYTEQDLGHPFYENIKTSLTKSIRVNPDIRFIYILTKVGDDVVFVADSENATSPDYSPPGQVYSEASEAVKNIFNTKETLIEDPYTDRWGTWISTLAYIDTESGVPLVVGMDNNARDHLSTLIIFSAIPALVFLFIFFLIWIGSVMHKNQQRMIKMKSDFIAIASHDLRAPLTGIRWSLENMIGNNTIPEDTRKKLSDMKFSAVTLLELINELLDIKLLESDAFKFSNGATCSLAEVVHETSDCQKLFASMKGISFEGQEKTPNIQVHGDHKRLYSVFNNIISNAVKYSPNGSNVIMNSEISVDGKYIDIHVIDHGIGIPKADLSKIKMGFFRSENAKKFAQSGTGYGVHVSDLVLESYGGSMKIESVEGKGTEVIIRLLIKK